QQSLHGTPGKSRASTVATVTTVGNVPVLHTPLRLYGSIVSRHFLDCCQFPVRLDFSLPASLIQGPLPCSRTRHSPRCSAATASSRSWVPVVWGRSTWPMPG